MEEIWVMIPKVSLGEQDEYPDWLVMEISIGQCHHNRSGFNESEFILASR